MGKFALILVAAIAIAQSAEDPFPGMYATHPKGFSVRPAAGWKARNNEQGIVLVPANAAKEEHYIVALQDGYSPIEELKDMRQLSQTLLQNCGRVRTAGERQRLAGGPTYYWEAADAKAGHIAGLKIYLIPSGARANMIIAFGVANRIRPRDNDLRQMLASIRSSGPQAKLITNEH